MVCVEQEGGKSEASSELEEREVEDRLRVGARHCWWRWDRKEEVLSRKR